MTIVAKRSVIEMMDDAKARAEKASKGFVPTFLMLKDHQKAILRPLFNLDECVPMQMHNKFNKVSPKDSINAVCASEQGKVCEYCQAYAAGDKQLAPKMSFMLPVYLYRVGQQNDDKTWSDVTYTDTEGNAQPVKGLRVLELKNYGTVSQVMDVMRSMFAEETDIRDHDFSIERKGAGTDTSYIVLPRAPKLMPEPVKVLIPKQQDVLDMVIAACPIHAVEGAGATASSSQDDEY